MQNRFNASSSRDTSRVLRPRTATLIAAAAIVALTATVAEAALPIYSGPTLAQGYDNANVTGNASGVLTLTGAAIGDVSSKINGSDYGTRALEYTPVSWHTNFALSYAANSTALGTAVAINEGRTIVGASKKRSGNGTDLGIRAVRFAYGAVVPTELNPINTDDDGVVFTSAVAINTAGLVVGRSGKYTAAGAGLGNRAVRWAPNTTTAIELPLTQFHFSATGFASAAATAVNDAGTIVGFTDAYDNNKDYAGTRAMRWKSNNTYAQLNPLGYNAALQTQCEAVDVNEAGITAGWSHKYDYNNDQAFVGRRAVRWGADTISGEELGVLGGTTVDGTSYAQVSSISDGGLILGQSNKYLLGAAIGNRAVYWNTTGSTAANELPNLGTAGGTTHGMARSANADDVIAGWSEQYSNNNLLGRRAVIWTTAGADAVINLNTLLAPGSGWVLTEAIGISDTGFVSGIGDFDPDGNGAAPSYERHFTMLVPSAGTYGRGDASFDTKTNFDDLLILSQNYGDANPTKNPYVGDLNLDGTVGFDDLLLVAQHYSAGGLTLGASFAGTFASDWALAQGMVPEPTTLSAVLVAAGFAGRRRRR